MDLIDVMRSKKRYEHFVNLWLKKAHELAMNQMEVSNFAEPAFYLLMIKGSKVDVDIVPVGHLFDTPANKNLVAQMIRQRCSQNRVLALIFITEAWVAVAHADNKEEISRITSEGPSNQPDKKECVFISKETPSGIEGEFYEIVGKDGKRSLGEKMSGDGSMDIGGRFSGLLYSPKFKN